MSEDESDRDPPPRLVGESKASTSSSSSPMESQIQPQTHTQPEQVLEIVLENILCFLTSRRDRSAASLVCKSWWRAEALTRSELFIGNCYAVSPARTTARFGRVRSVTIKGKPRFSDFNLMPLGWGAYFIPWAEALSVAYPAWLRKINLKRMAISDEALTLISRSLPNFTDLVLSCCEDFSSVGLAAIAANCRHLRVLELLECDVIDEVEVDWISCFPESNTGLESLIFDCVDSDVNFEALEDLVIRSPGLRKLRLNRWFAIEGLCRLMARAPQLTHLGTGSFSINSAAALNNNNNNNNNHNPLELYTTSFEFCKSITCLSGFRETDPEYLPAIYPVCANLTTLNFSYANITAEELNPIISNCHNLQTFWVLDSICDEGLQAVAASCKELRELRVFPFAANEEIEGPVSEVGLQAISEGCRKLQSILYFCQRMTNAAVKAMSHNCPDLVVFRLCIMGRLRPDHLTGQPMDEGFGAIVMNCKKLTRLAVSGLLTDRAFSYIGKYGKLIRTLSVAFNGDSDDGLRYVLEGCSNLQKLEIRDSPFGDAALRSGLHHYYNMRFLWMSCCKLTRQGCKEIARAMPNLVVEVMRSGTHFEVPLGENDVEILYMYRSLEPPRDDAPRGFVDIL